MLSKLFSRLKGIVHAQRALKKLFILSAFTVFLIEMAYDNLLYAQRKN